MAAVRLCRCRCRALLSRPAGAVRARRGLAAGPEMHFGFQTVTEEERREKIYQVFENVAKKYDVMNDSMTLGIHRVWKDILVHKMNPCPGTLLLDVAGGTGDIAFRFINYVRSVRQRQLQRKLKHHQNLSWQEIFESYQKDKFNSLGDSQVVVCDINREMLKVGKQKAEHLGYSEVEVHASQIDMVLILWGLGSNTAATASHTDSPGGGSVAFHVPQPVEAFYQNVLSVLAIAAWQDASTCL